MIKTKNGTRYQFPLSEVRQIVKVQVDGKTQTSEIQLPVSSDFCGQLEVSGGISNAKYVFGYSPNIQATVAFGNKQLFGKNLFLGVGVGYNNTFIGSNSAVLGLLPVFARVQSVLTKKRTSPCVGMDAGYAFSTNPNFGGGALIKVSIGIIHKLNYKTSFIAGVYAGLNSISGTLTETNDLGTFSYKGNTMMQNFGVKFGLQF